MGKVSTWIGTVRKAVANAFVLTGAWSAAVVDSPPGGVTAKEWSALLVIWIGVVVVYLTGNDTPATGALEQRVPAPGEMLVEGVHSGAAVAVSGHGSADDGTDAQAAGAPPRADA